MASLIKPHRVWNEQFLCYDEIYPGSMTVEELADSDDD